MRFVLLERIWDCLVALLGAKWGRTSAKVRAMKSRQNFSQQTQPIRPHWTLNSCFFAFRTIWVHLDCLVASKNSRQNGPNWCESSCPEVALELFATNTPDPPHWTLNSCSGTFHTNFAAFGTVWLVRKNSVQNGATGAKVRATMSRRKFSQRTQPILLIGL